MIDIVEKLKKVADCTPFPPPAEWLLEAAETIEKLQEKNRRLTKTNKDLKLKLKIINERVDKYVEQNEWKYQNWLKFKTDALENNLLTSVADKYPKVTTDFDQIFAQSAKQAEQKDD